MVRSPCCYVDDNLKKGPWTAEEDKKLVDYINKHGHGSWRVVPKLAGLNRCGKSCRLRWMNYLRPDIKRGKFSDEEERLIVNLHTVIGNRWSRIAAHLPGRTDNEIKNYWNTHIRKKLLQMGIDPNTHKPRTDLNHIFNISQLLGGLQFGNLTTSVPWENILKLQADATQLAKIQLLQNLLQSLLENQTIEELPNPLAYIEGGLNMDTNCLSSYYDIQTENPLPQLVTTETNTNYYSDTLKVFESLDKLMPMDDDSFWKDILE